MQVGTGRKRPAGGTTHLPFLERIIREAGYQGRKMEAAVAWTAFVLTMVAGHFVRCQGVPDTHGEIA